jgi:hypothetical protein
MKTIEVEAIEHREELAANARTAIYWKEKIVLTSAVFTKRALLGKYL